MIAKAKIKLNELDKIMLAGLLQLVVVQQQPYTPHKFWFNEAISTAVVAEPAATFNICTVRCWLAPIVAEKPGKQPLSPATKVRVAELPVPNVMPAVKPVVTFFKRFFFVIFGANLEKINLNKKTIFFSQNYIKLFICIIG